MLPDSVRTEVNQKNEEKNYEVQESFYLKINLD